MSFFNKDRVWVLLSHCLLSGRCNPPTAFNPVSHRKYRANTQSRPLCTIDRTVLFVGVVSVAAALCCRASADSVAVPTDRCGTTFGVSEVCAATDDHFEGAVALAEVYAKRQRLPVSAMWSDAFYRGAAFAHLVFNLRANGTSSGHTRSTFVELGVQSGLHSYFFLLHLRKLWNSTSAPFRLFLVDTWRHAPVSELYNDTSNVHDIQQRAFLHSTVDQVAPFWRQISILQLSTQEAARLFMPNSLHFVYHDARHDYCAVRDDLSAYWPKVVPGGFMAGDDVDAPGASQWPDCQNGTRVVGGLRQAVDEFASAAGLRAVYFHSQWLLRKPSD
eukprot:TRINITY_DN63156_c0_g1_i1.p1 TRINITY_DN63156_c0_g1~~TRINITY_DN63156_c0_g1_i1.p1  ORF type:complete len:331 (-),score=37.77 TRINITY_DN63156_c0_g1_i1:31-1023(-)